MKLAKLILICGTISTVILVPTSAWAGRFVFMEGNSGTQDVVGTVEDSSSQAIDFKRDSRFVNDEARSVRLQYVEPGTRLLIYDSPSGSTSDDWAEIIVKQKRPDLVIATFERTVDTDDYAITYHRNNGLDGKVSHIKVYPGTPIAAANKLEQIQQNLAREYSGWPAKRGEAYEYSSQDSQYRVWKPEVTQLPNRGYQLSVKLDHIRTAAQDDHAKITMTFDESGLILKADSEVSLDQGLFKSDKIFTNTLNVIDELPEDQKTNKYVAVTQSALKLAEAIYADLLALGESGGRLLFKDVIGHNMNRIGNAVVAVTSTNGQATPLPVEELPRRRPSTPIYRPIVPSNPTQIQSH